MFGKVTDFLKGNAGLKVDASGNPTDSDVILAAGVLLLEMAGTDNDYAPEEVKAIFDSIQEEFGITERAEIHALLEEAQELRREKEKIDEFVAEINIHFKSKQRVRLLSMVWRVVLADGSVDKFEARFAKQLQHRLKLTDEEMAQAKELAQHAAK